MDADNRSGLPLSLQDMCMLCIMLRLEEFPTDSLALLPSAIRRRLFLGLAHADLLHVDTEVLFGDLNLFDLSHQRGPVFAREELLDVILRTSDSAYFLKLNLGAALGCYQWIKSTRLSDLKKHICKCYPSLEPTMVPWYHYGGFVLPKRFLQFVFLDWNHDPFQVPLELAQPLLAYCKMQRAPPNLKIKCSYFQKTMFWKQFEEHSARLRNKTPIEKMDPVIPFLQDFLSSVEELELSTDRFGITAYVILYNIVTSSHPCLKHLKIDSLSFVEQLFVLKPKSNLSVYKPCTSDKDWKRKVMTEEEKASIRNHMHVPFASSLLDPYPLEGLSVYCNIHVTHGRDLASQLQSLVEFHMHTLKHVTVHYSIDVQDCNKDRVVVIDIPAFATLLSSFTQLLKQPQFCALNVGGSPLSGACALIETFLTTPASHEQTLYVEGLDELDLMEREKIEDNEDSSSENEEEEEQEESTGESVEDIFVVKRQRITKQRKKLPKRIVSLSCSTWSHNIPETNAQFKCLDPGHSSSCIYSLLFSLPELKLKKLRMRTQDMTLISADTAIKVEHVVFSTQTHTSYKPTISPAHLEKFTISNPVLKRLEFERPMDEWCTPGLIPALIHCLSKLYQQGRGLDELVLDSGMFDRIDIREFLTTMRHLSHQHGTTLVLTPPKYYRVFSWYQREFVDLGKDFQETKIKKIVCNMEDHHDDPRPQLGPLAEKVVVNYSRWFHTISGRKCCL